MIERVGFIVFALVMTIFFIAHHLPHHVTH